MDQHRPALIRPARLLLLPAAVIGVGFFLWPMASIIATGLGRDPAAAAAVIRDSGFASVAWFTVWQAAVSTLLTLAIGLPVTYAVSRFAFPGRVLVRTLLTVPFVLPTVVVAAAFLSLIGPGGVLGIDLAGTVWAVIAAHVFFNIAVVVRTVGGLWAHLDPTLTDAAATLGAGPWRTFRTVTLPILRPAIIAAAAIVFLFSFTSFGIVLLLGAPRLATLEVEIYRAAARLGDLATAATLAVVQLAGVTAGLLLYARHQERSGIAQHLLPAAATSRPPRPGQRWLVATAIAVSLSIVLLPISVLVWRVFAPDGSPGLGAFRALSGVDPSVVDPMGAVANSLLYGLTAAAIALGVALPAAVVIAARHAGRWVDTLIMLPLGSSAVTLGFGFVVALDAPVDMRTWWVLVPIAHALVAVPFVVRTAVPVIRSISPRLREAARTLGAPPRRVWRTIDLPMVSPALAGAAALAFVISLGEFGATLFIARRGGQTMTLAIFRLLERPGSANVSAALALSLLLVALTAAAVLLLERLRAPGAGSF